jgi:hypothetical protein
MKSARPAAEEDLDKLRGYLADDRARRPAAETVKIACRYTLAWACVQHTMWLRMVMGYEVSGKHVETNLHRT